MSKVPRLSSGRRAGIQARQGRHVKAQCFSTGRGRNPRVPEYALRTKERHTKDCMVAHVHVLRLDVNVGGMALLI